MHEELGRLMVGSSIGVWDAPIDRREVQDEITELLAQVPLFSGLSRRHRARIARVAQHKHFLRYSTLVRVGDPGDAFYVILEGQAVVDLPGSRIALEPGAFFGEMAIIDGAPRSATVTAETDVVVLVIPRDGFLSVLQGEPTVALEMLTTLARRLREATAA